MKTSIAATDITRELEDDLVPEWRAKYINYKQGKKKIKAISKALRNANRTPKTRPVLSHVSSTASIPYTHYDFKSRAQRRANGQTPAGILAQLDGVNIDGNTRQQYADMRRMSTTMFSTSPPIDAPESRPESSSEDNSDGEESDEERTPLKKSTSGTMQETPTSYGSFSPPKKDDKKSPTPGRMSKLALPDPALDPGRERVNSPEEISEPQRSQSEVDGRTVQLKNPSERPEAKKNNSHPLMRRIVQMRIDKQRKEQGGPAPTTPSPKTTARERFRKIFQPKQIDGPNVSATQQAAYNELDQRQDDFFNFLDKELDKVERFYKTKEDEARDRLTVLRAQLHEHRDQRARDMQAERQGKHHLKRQDDRVSNMLHQTPLPTMPKHEINGHNGALFKNVFQHEPKVGKTSKAMNKLASPPTSPATQAKDDARDFVKKKPTAGNETVPHRFAKRRLKLALQEFYRGMELLKSYALLNRTGFRKINKKYDKAVNARPPLRYLNEKVSDAHFVKSTLIDEYIVAVEDLYARYFERGNRKVAVNKLRSRLQQGDHSGSTFRNGLWIAGGSGLGVAGLYNATQHLYGANPMQKMITSYLLQIYAGYFLALLLFLLFVLDCKIWTMARINYIFVFEYDTRHVLDWRQLAEIPCFFLFLNGLFVWINFQFEFDHVMYQYIPVILIVISVVTMCLPFKVLYYHSRKWWGFSNFRLLFAGIYPVEFRDFFLGDMYCSETYAMSQLEVFFCLYRWNWQNPAQCNSNHSMLLGFFTCLPAIWRFLQCVRRYHDSGNWFPHLANCAKYGGNILYYMSLSLYRLHVGSADAWKYRIIMIVFACLNGLYCSIWDVFMDWSLGNFFSKNRGLRNHLAYRRKWIYWAAIVFNTILRHQWIFYAIFTEDLQHSASMSFFVGLAEVIRRGVWTLFRVENEHTNNVASFRASRDIPLPYSIPQSPKMPEEGDSGDLRKRKGAVSSDPKRAREESTASTTGADHDLEMQTTQDSSSTVRRRMSNTPALRALQRVGTAIAAAHSQDFQKKRRPEVGDTPHDDAMIQDDDQQNSSDEDEDPRHVIQVSDNEDDPSPRQRLGRTKQDKKKQSQRAPVEDDTDENDDGGEGSSGESRERAVNRDAEIHNEHDVEEARNLAQAFSPEAGFRGGAKSASKKDS